MTLPTVVLETPRLVLQLQTPEEAMRWLETLPAADRAEVSPEWIARLASTAPGDVWRLAFTIRTRVDECEVGSCAFKAPPDADGVVEIAYGLQESARGRGYATEAAGALVDYCCEQPEVRTVRAHTKSWNAPSIAVLRRCGFTLVGDVMDPEDGEVERWERPAA